MPHEQSHQVTYNSHRFLQTYRHVALVLQLLSGIATVSTFLRISEQFRLPSVFLALPSLLFVITIVSHCIPLHDVGIMAIVIGAVTGAIAGFVSTVVGQHDYDSDSPGVTPSRSDLVTFLCSLEFLHIPAVIGAIMYTFCLLFTRLPPLTLIVIAAATAACGTVIVGIGITITSDPMFIGSGTQLAFSLTSIFATLGFVFLAIFVLALMPALRHNKRAWLICVVALTLSVRWQSAFLDSAQWDWEKSFFPIPGSLVGTVILYLIEIVELSESAGSTAKKSSLRHERLSSSSDDVLLTAVMWHIGAYVVERTSLTLILDSRRHNASKAGQNLATSDAWLCCLGMLGLLALFTPAVTNSMSLLRRIIVVCLGLLLYVCLTVTTTSLTNGYFIDDILGIALFATTATTDFAASTA